MFVEVITTIETRKLNRTFTYHVPQGLQGQISIGQSVLVPFGRGNKEIQAYVVNLVDSVNDTLGKRIKEVKGIAKEQTDINETMLVLANRIKDHYFLPLASILKMMVLEKGKYHQSIEGKTLNITSVGLEGVNQLRKSKRQTLLTILSNNAIPAEEVLAQGFTQAMLRDLLKLGWIEATSRKTKATETVLKDKQEKVLKEIQGSIEAKEHKVFLLFGVTGSGKTEVYFRSIEACLNKGKQALVLLPEINLTEQMLGRYEEAFPGNVVRWHSQVSPGEKRKAWDQINSKERNILIGPRSAVFTNFSELGLIVIDEEHDTSYVQQSMPAYSGKQVALLRGELENAVVVLGSATPSVESMHQVEAGTYHLLTLEDKYYGQENPEVEILDMSDELRAGNHSVISRRLKESIQTTLDRGEQVLLFLNRRGYYNFIMCRDCGLVIQCSDCHIPMTYHEKEHRLICHYCGKISPQPKTCPICQSSRIRGIGIGTEQVVGIVEKAFPAARVKRLDGDIRGGTKERQKILEDFKDTQTDILIGTQIVAKGIDFPNVGLVGILLGDLSLNFPDYRAREWTFQLLMQVIGRTGRREKKGEVLLQTYRPFDIIYKDIRQFDFKGFYQQELTLRKTYGYPPFGEILRLQFSGKDKILLTQVIWTFFDQLEKEFDHSELYKPKANRIEKHGEYYRWSIVMKLKKERLQEKEKQLRKLFEQYYESNTDNVLFYIERNPVGFL